MRAAIHWVLGCSRFRVPEPVRLAEQIVNRLKREATFEPRAVGHAVRHARHEARPE